jgi:hypothetical protein
MHDHDGSYTHGNYDAILPYQDWTDLNLGWTDHAAGVGLLVPHPVGRPTDGGRPTGRAA